MFSRYQYGFIDIEDNNYLFLTFIGQQYYLIVSNSTIPDMILLFTSEAVY
jgi:hypothetical protein